VGIYAEDKQVEWLQRKAEMSGFRILQVQVRNDGKLKDERNSLELLTVQFDGLLQVIDSDRLAKAVTNGIGSAKGFGFGLLSLAAGRSD
jgi:CRISPR system Cascade subunit CasE